MSAVIESNNIEMFAKFFEAGKPIQISSCRPAVQQNKCWRIVGPLHFTNECLTAIWNIDYAAGGKRHILETISETS